jgi:CBS domain-containing protein
MKSGDYVRKYRDKLPRFVIIWEAAEIGKIIDVFMEGAEYAIVMSKEGDIEGLIRDNDIVFLLSKSPRLVTFSPMLKLSLRNIKIPPEVVAGLTAEDVMRRRPVIIREDEPLEEAIELMKKMKTEAAVIIDRYGKPLAVVDENSIVKTVFRELKEERRKKAEGK